jgi:hypothetical protein
LAKEKLAEHNVRAAKATDTVPDSTVDVNAVQVD